MPIDRIHKNIDFSKSHERENGVVTFDEYRELCQTFDPSYRVTGIFSRKLFNTLVSDPTTIFATNAQRRVPILVSIRDPYYNLEAIERMTGVPGDSCLFLAVPISSLEVLDNFENIQQETKGKPILLEVTSAISDEKLASLESIFGKTVSDFIDERITDDLEDQKASFSLFGFEAAIRPENRELCVGDSNINSAWEKYKFVHNIPEKPATDSNLTYVYCGEELRNNSELLDSLWGITQHGFGSILGAYHPVSMDVDEEFFIGHITHPNNHIAVRFLDGEPVCYGTVTPDLTLSDWMRRDALEAISQKNKLLFSEVISNKRGLRLSADITKVLADICTMTGLDFTVLFESTNLSKRYVIPIVERTFNESIAQIKTDIIELDRLRYKYLL